MVPIVLVCCEDFMCFCLNTTYINLKKNLSPKVKYRSCFIDNHRMINIETISDLITMSSFIKITIEKNS